MTILERSNQLAKSPPMSVSAPTTNGNGPDARPAGHAAVWPCAAPTGLAPQPQCFHSSRMNESYCT